MKLTDKERTILNGIFESEYNGESGQTWTFSAIEHSGLDGRIASGVLASLVKKEFVTMGGTYGDDQDESTITITDLGKLYLRFTPVVWWDNKERIFIITIKDVQENQVGACDYAPDRIQGEERADEMMRELTVPVYDYFEYGDNGEWKWNDFPVQEVQ